MHLTSFLAAHLALSVPFALANDSGHPTSRCYTGWGPHSPPRGAPTITRTSHTPCKTTETTTIITTSTPKSSIITSTHTTTTVISTSTVVPEPQGFSPIQDTLADSFYDGSQGGSPAQRRRRSEKGLLNSLVVNPVDRLVGGREYATAVTCYTWAPSKTCSTVLETSTSTVFATQKKLAVKATTTTVTSTSYTTTIYAACATNNFADQITTGGDTCHINSLAPGSTSELNGEDIDLLITNAYDCCVFAITDPHNAQFWAYLPGASTAGQKACYVLVTDEQNPPVQSDYQFAATCVYNDTSQAIVLGNGFYGEVNSVSTPTPTPTAQPTRRR